MATRVPLSPDVIVRAAVAHVDEHGMESLTLRSLGEDLGTHFTALYRHFANKEELISAMFDFVVADINEKAAVASDEPLARIAVIAQAFRDALHEHPALVGTILSTSGTASTYLLQQQVAADMEMLGIPKDEIPARYQMLETYVFGSVMFDYLGAPHHLELRKARYGEVGGQFKAAAKSQKSIDANNEHAFTLGLRTLIASFAAQK